MPDRSINEIKNPVKKSLKNVFRRDEMPILLLLIASIILWMILSPTLQSQTAIFDVLRELAPYMITVIGVGILMICGEFDLSVGALLACVGVASVTVLNATGNTLLGILAGIGMGVLIGAINSFFVVKLKLSSLIATLTMMFILRGAVYIYTGRKAIVAQDFPEIYNFIFYGSIWKIPFPFILAVVLLIIVQFVLTKTSYGRNIFATGGNSMAALASGIKINRIKFSAFLFCSIFASISGILIVSQTYTGYFDAGITGWELTALTACVLGGLSLAGGDGSIVAAVLGMLVLGITNKGLRLMGVYTTWTLVVTGIIMIIAIYTHEIRRTLLTRIRN